MKIKKLIIVLTVLFFSSTAYALTLAADGVYFGNLADGQKVTSPFKVEMKVVGKTVAQAGDPAPNTGHHHLIINGEHIDKGKIIPADATHIHFGKGQTETEVKLDKGSYTLTLQFADLNHLSFGKEWSQTIKIQVE